MRFPAPVLTLFTRELKAYFHSPIGYVVAMIFLFITGFFFGVTLKNRLLVIDQLFWQVSVVLIFITPAVSMRLISEEIRSGTIETLLTDPVRGWEVAVGKYLGAVAFMVLLLLPVGAFCLFVHQLGERQGGLDPGPIVGGLIGLFLMVSAALALGMLFSALTRNQIVAAVVTFMALFLLFFLHLLGPVVGERSALARDVTHYLSLSAHLFRFFRGQIVGIDVIYFAKLAALGVFLTVVALESRRWR